MTQARVDRPRSIVEIVVDLGLQPKANIWLWLERRVIAIVRRGVLGQGPEIIRSALNYQRALDSQRRQPAHASALLRAILQLFREQSAL